MQFILILMTLGSCILYGGSWAADLDIWYDARMFV